MYLIAGLGNPTKEYDKTRHNAGFSVIDVLADRYRIDVSEKKHKALCGRGVIEGQKVLLLKPQTFMNLSGESIRDVYKRQGEYAPSTYDPKVYQFDLVTIGEHSVIPENVKIGKNTAISGVTVLEDYPDGLLASGDSIIKARCV